MTRPTPTATQADIQRDGRLVLRLAKLFCTLDLPGEGLEIAQDRPTLVCGNHRSLFDVFCAAAFCATTNLGCRFLVQATFFDNAITGRWLRRIGCIPLNTETKEAAFAEARASLESGQLIGIMPEGRLVPAHERLPQVGPARPGASELATLAGAYLRPIAFHNTEKVWPRGKWPRFRWRRPHVTMQLSDVHIVPTNDPQADMDKVMGVLTEMLDRLDAANPSD